MGKNKEYYLDMFNKFDAEIDNLKKRKAALYKEYIEDVVTLKVGDKVRVSNTRGEIYFAYIEFMELENDENSWRTSKLDGIGYGLYKVRKDGTVSSHSLHVSSVASIEKINP